MKKFETISQSLFDQRSAEAILKTPIRKEVSLKDIEIVKPNTLKVENKLIRMNSDAFKGICKVVGLPVGFDKTFSSAFGDKARQALVNRLKVAVQAKGATSLSLVVNPDAFDNLYEFVAYAMTYMEFQNELAGIQITLLAYATSKTE